ncbi:ras-related protein Rab-38 [Xyrichtys novacula]|uniref:Ras-related protein Rab-38 n=1 Tax=Xyrichtys novacula TaxID=13765 RepID=A0AAV1FRQ1_XYRNO|nr:ras-related protein Rab-38 [Xyrichtys novacula]
MGLEFCICLLFRRGYYKLHVLFWINKQSYSEAEHTSPGQERFGNMTRVYYREAMGAFIVFDVTRHTTFEAVVKWKEDLDSKLTLADGQSIATVLLANKCDQGRELISNGIKMDQFCKDHGFVGWFETSAKDNLNIGEAANFLVKHIIATENEILKSVIPDTISPQYDNHRQSSCSGCFK